MSRAGQGARGPARLALCLAALLAALPALAPRDAATAPVPRLYRLSPDTQPLRIEAVASGRHWWFRYPDHPRIPARTGVLRLPAGRTVEIATRAADAPTVFWVPELAGKIAVTAGRTAKVYLVPRAAGLHAALCEGPCNPVEGPLPFVVEVMPPEAFDNWIGGQP
jgi:heme/copper-type cytochrome/quinol oxidase subunit 2